MDINGKKLKGKNFCEEKRGVKEVLTLPTKKNRMTRKQVFDLKTPPSHNWKWSGLKAVN